MTNKELQSVIESCQLNVYQDLKVTEQMARELIRMRGLCQSILDVHEGRGAALTAACGDTDIVCRAREALTDAEEGEKG